MSESFDLIILPDNQGFKPEITHTDVHNVVLTNGIQCVVQSDVDLNRQTEIIEGWKQLWEHMRDTNQLSSAGGPIYLARNIDAPKHGSRQLIDLAGVELDDIVIGVGANVNVADFQAMQTLDSGFRMLREYASENFFKFT